MDRVKTSDWVLGISGLLMFISVWFSWYKVSLGGYGVYISGGGISGWLATKLTIFLILFGLASMAIVALRIFEVDLSVIPVPIPLIVIGMGALCTLIVVIRLFVKQAGLGISWGIFFSLIASIGVIVGGVLGLQEEA